MAITREQDTDPRRLAPPPRRAAAGDVEESRKTNGRYNGALGCAPGDDTQRGGRTEAPDRRADEAPLSSTARWGKDRYVAVGAVQDQNRFVAPDVSTLIEQERGALAEFLETLTAEEWLTPSLCS